ncbi:MAG TPA: hypothetical protein VHV57_08145 [Acidimicrobiales bacterium]|jgi:hypothetical protein|nr:hypothetical protein [Acidimicrobiales bacterium]
MPVNWYAALILIVLIGIGSVVVARVHYANGGSSVQPTIGQTWHAGLAFDVCGTIEPALAASTSTTDGLIMSTGGLMVISPKVAAEAGDNATLGKFASENTTLKLSNTSVQYPSGTLYNNGQACAKGTPDAGKKGTLRVKSWTISTKTSKGNEIKLKGGSFAFAPKDLKLTNGQLIMVAFIPSNATVPKVPSSTEIAVLQALEGTAAPVTTTTAGATTTTPTTAPVTTTTAAGGTTTTTTKPAS